jgi:hypothetical protein
VRVRVWRLMNVTPEWVGLVRELGSFALVAWVLLVGFTKQEKATREMERAIGELAKAVIEMKAAIQSVADKEKP